MAELIAVRNLKTYFPVRRGLFRTTFVKAVDDLKRETREAIKGKKAEAADNDEKLEDSPADTDGE